MAVPNSVLNIQFFDISTTAIRLTWQDGGGNPDYYIVEYKVENSNNLFVEAGIVPANIQGLNVTGLTQSTNYEFRVFAVNADGSSESTTGFASTATDGYLPADPTNIQASNITNNSATITWVDNATDETSYEIEVQNQTALSTSKISIGPNTTTYNVVGLVPGETYRIWVKALKNPNLRSGGIYVDVTTTGTSTAPAAPTNLTHIVPSGVNYVRLQWQDNSNNETAFVIEKEGSTVGEFNEVTRLPPNVTQYDTFVVPTQQLKYRVRALNGVGSSLSNTITVPATYILPPVPTNVNISDITQTTAKLTFTDVATDETNYILNKKNNQNTYQLFATLPANSNTYNITGLSPSTEYSFMLMAKNSVGNSTGIIKTFTTAAVESSGSSGSGTNATPETTAQKTTNYTAIILGGIALLFTTIAIIIGIRKKQQ